MLKFENAVPCEPIKLTVVVVSACSHPLLRRCLDGILANKIGHEIEILAADCCSDEPIHKLMEEYPKVRFIHYPTNVGMPLLAGAGIKQSKGEIVALTDASCVVGGDWIKAIIEAHQLPALVIGGAVEVREKMKPLDWAAYFCEYGQFMRPLKMGAVDVLPGNNISFKRSALERGTEYVEPGFWKTYWCEKLRVNGIELVSEPAILTYYAREFQFVPFFIRRFHHGRCFAGMRTEQSSPVIRMLYFCGSLILVPVLLYRTIITILAKKRLFREFVRSFPHQILAVTFWSVGETCGYIRGKGKSCEQIY